MGDVTVKYYDKKTNEAVDLKFTEADFTAAKQDAAKPSLFSIPDFCPPSWKKSEVKDFPTVKKERWIQWISTNAISSQEFLSHYRTELDTMFQDLLKTPWESRKKDGKTWQNRRYFPKGQDPKKPKERLQTFAAFIYKKLKRSLGLPVGNSSQRQFNADGTPFVPLEERLQKCGMGYFYNCKQDDLITMYRDARGLLLKHSIRVITPGMIMAKFFEQSTEGQALAREHSEIYRNKLERLQSMTGGTSGAYMSALMYAADELTKKSATSTGFVKGRKTEQRNNITQKEFAIGQESKGTHTNINPRNYAGLNSELAGIRLAKIANRQRRRARFVTRAEEILDDEAAPVTV